MELREDIILKVKGRLDFPAEPRNLMKRLIRRLGRLIVSNEQRRIRNTAYKAVHGVLGVS